MDLLAPPITPLPDWTARMRAHGHAVLDAAGTCALADTPLAAFEELRPSWNDLPPDTHLRDGGRYRRRRHACFVVAGETLEHAPRRAHWQPVEYNALHGGLVRWFEPIETHVTHARAWSRLVCALAARCSALKGARPWFVEAHQFRIDTSDGIGRPTPEGAHRDGVDFVALMLIERAGVVGGETRVFEAAGPHGLRFTLSEPWTLLFLDDERVIHESTPIQPLHPPAHRDTLVLTFKADGFLGDAPDPARTSAVEPRAGRGLP